MKRISCICLSLLCTVSLTGCNVIKNILTTNTSDLEMSTSTSANSEESSEPEESLETEEFIDLADPTTASVTDTVIEKTENTSGTAELSGFSVTYEYDNYFSIREEYYFDGSKYESVIITFIPGSLRTIEDICNACKSPPSPESFTESNGAFTLTTEFGKPYLLPRIANLQIDDAYDLAVEQCDIITESNDKGPRDRPWIQGISKSRLATRKVSMHISSGETKQIAISKCPEGYEDKLLFKSNNVAAAKVDKNGNVTGIKQGAATITISIDGLAVYTFITIYVY